VHTKASRSYKMSKIKRSKTKPEMIMRKFLHSEGMRYSLHNKKLPGKPDLTLTKYKTVIFVNGCFWHGHEDCENFQMPKSNTDYWEPKIKGNKERDKRNNQKLESVGWNVITIWECEVKNENSENKLKDLYKEIKKTSDYEE